MGNQDSEGGWGMSVEKWCQTEPKFGLWEPLESIRKSHWQSYTGWFFQTKAHNKMTTSWDYSWSHGSLPSVWNVCNHLIILTEKRGLSLFVILLFKNSENRRWYGNVTYLSDLVQDVSDLCRGHQTWPALPGRRPAVQEEGTYSSLFLHSGEMKTF